MTRRCALQVLAIAGTVLVGAAGCGREVAAVVDAGVDAVVDACVAETVEALCSRGNYCSHAELTDRCGQLHSVTCDPGGLCEIETCEDIGPCEASPDCEDCFTRTQCCQRGWCEVGPYERWAKCWAGVPEEREQTCDPEQDPWSGHPPPNFCEP